MHQGIEYLLREARTGDAIFTIGAGNISRASNELMVLLGTERPTTHAHR
jgi:UDP-N-acetylmuramate-alanine ligase